MSVRIRTLKRMARIYAIVAAIMSIPLVMLLDDTFIGIAIFCCVWFGLANYVIYQAIYIEELNKND